MPAQETFLELQRGARRIRVVKTYDTTYARSVFHDVDQASLRLLAASLNVAGAYDPSDIPAEDSPDYSDFIWEELLDGAREDGQIRSFFLVTVEQQGKDEKIPFIAADWPTAEAYAKSFDRGNA